MSGASRLAFVTGATGFVGGSLARALGEAGWRVATLCRTPEQASVLSAAGLNPTQGDVTDSASLERALPQGADAIFHLAADISLSAASNERQTQTNVDGTRNMVAAALKRGARRFVHTSTCSAYGRTGAPLTEETPSRAPTSWINYELSKWRAEEEVRAGVARGLDAVIINPFAILGPGDRSGWASLFAKLKAGAMPMAPPGTATFNHVDDVVAAHLAAVDRGRTGQNYLLPGADASFTSLLAEMARRLGLARSPGPAPAWLLRGAARVDQLRCAISGSSPELTPEMAELMIADMRCGSNRAQRELGCGTTPLQKSVADSHRWLVAEGLI